jgi:predicted porin
MKKSLIAAAVAGLFAAPAFAATSNVDVYGVMNIAIQDTDADGADIDVVDNVSRIGFKGSEDLGGGLKAIWQIEQGINATGNDSLSSSHTHSTYYGTSGSATVKDNSGAFGGKGLRNTFVGLAGNFGTAIVGRHDTPYKIATGKYDIFSDTIADYNGGAGGYTPDGVDLLDKTHDARASNAVAYISPSFSGLTIAAAVIVEGNEGQFDVAGDSVDAYSLAAMYSNGPLTIDAAYQDVESYSQAWKIGAGYTFGDLTLGAVYENVENDAGSTHPVGSNGERDSWLVNAKYAMGPMVIKGLYGQADVNSTDKDMWAVGLDYNMSKRTTAYVIYAAGDDDSTTTNGGDVGGWNIGVKHSF